MNKVTRVLTMAGMGIMAAVAMAGPAQAAGSADASSTSKPTVQKSWDRDREWTHDYYRSYRACDLAGRIGERFGKWDDYECEYQRRGWHRGQFALEVERDRHFFGGRPHHNRHDGRPNFIRQR